MLQVRGFYPSREKVKQVELHPVQPWLCVVTNSDTITVWDWSSSQVVHEAGMGGVDEDSNQEAMLAKLAERDPTLGSNPSSVSTAPSRIPSGKVKDVKFLDPEVANYQMLAAQLTMTGTALPYLSCAAVGALEGCRLLVVCCENKLVVMDLLSKRCQELPKVAFDNKTPCAVAFMFPHPKSAVSSSAAIGPILAVGCSDGSVRLVSLVGMRVFARLAPAHNKALTCILAQPPRGAPSGSGGEVLVAGDAGGYLLMWDVFGRPLTLGEGAPPPKLVVQGHESAVTSLLLGCVMEDVESTIPRLFTAGLDNKIVGWDPLTLKEQSRIKLDPKTPVAGVSYCPRNYAVLGAHNLLMGTRTPFLVALHTQSGAVRPVCNLTGLVPSGSKKSPKIYAVACHPLQPHIAVAGINTGTVLVTYDTSYLPPVLPLAMRRAADPDNLLAAFDDTPTVTYATLMGTELMVMTATASTMQDDMGSRSMVARVNHKSRAISLGQSGKALLGASSDGRYISVLWPVVRAYVIYHKPVTTWEECDKGSAVSLAWHSQSPCCALLDEPAPAMPPDLLRMGSKKRGKGPDPEMLKAAMGAAQQAVAASTVVRVKRLRGGSAEVVPGSLALRGDSPAALHSGPMLAVVFRNTAALGDPGAVETPRAAHFFDWDSLQRVGRDFPEPAWMSWDPTMHLCAMGYPTQVLLFALQPSFACVAALPISGAVSAAWSARQLFIATHTTVQLVFVITDRPEQAPLTGFTSSRFQVVTLASFDAGASAHLPHRSSKDTGLPPPEPRPPGPLVALGMSRDVLWLLNANGLPIALPLTHPGLRTRCLVASGEYDSARALAEQKLSPQHHDSLAAFMCAMGAMAGAQAALTLPGLSLEMELEVCIAAQQWQRALAASKAMLAGCSQRPAGLQAAAPGMLGAEAEPAGMAPTSRTPILPADYFSSPQLDPLPSASLSMEAENGPPPGPDWDAPLRELVDKQSPSVSRHVSAHALGLVLKLADAALLAVNRDLAKSALRLVSPHVASLSSTQLAQLAVRMVEAGMQEELKGVCGQSVDASMPGIVATAASGDASLVSRTLLSAQMPGVAALHASSFRLPCAQAAQSAHHQSINSGGMMLDGSHVVVRVSPF